MDIDIALLGNKVTALASSKIHSYFTTKNGSTGIYVLAIQTPTLWMDAGNNQFHNGDFESRYSGIFMDLLNDYLSKNSEELLINNNNNKSSIFCFYYFFD